MRAFLRELMLAIEIAGKEVTLPYISTPIARANAEEHLRLRRNALRQLQRGA